MQEDIIPSPPPESDSLTDPDLQAVAKQIRVLDPEGLRIAQVLRETIDQLYDGQRTGRYKWDQLFRTEKIYCGNLVEINLQREFAFQDGSIFEIQIAGIEVDCHFSPQVGNWIIPPETRGHLCLLISAEDSPNPKWSMGLVRINPEKLNLGSSQEPKSTLNQAGLDAIFWLFKQHELPPNVLLQLDPALLEKITSIRPMQKRIEELFRHTLGMRVTRNVIATLSHQNDFMKQVCSRSAGLNILQSEGIIVLRKDKSHAAIAAALHLPVPAQGDCVPVRVVPVQKPGPGVAEISGNLWTVARQNDPVVTAPTLPEG